MNTMHAKGQGRNWPTIALARLQVVKAGMEESADDFIERAAPTRDRTARPYYSTSANGQVIAECHGNPAFEQTIVEADEIHADGMSLVLFTRWFCKQQLPERVATTDLVHAVAKRAEKTGTRFYFLGATPQVNDDAVAKMKELYPDLIFAGARNGYFTADQEDAVIEEVIKSGTDILWVGFGIPLEQQFVSRNIDKLKGVAVIKTCGGLFDFLAGRNKRAPQWMQDMGLEWLHRMLQEPRRLGKRYLLTNPLAIYALLQHRFFPKRAAAAKKLPRTKTRPNPKPYQMSQPK